MNTLLSLILIQELRLFLSQRNETCRTGLKLVPQVCNSRGTTGSLCVIQYFPVSVWGGVGRMSAMHAEACVWMAAVLSGPWSSGWWMTTGGCNVEHGPHLLFSSGMCRGAGARIWNILICCWDCCFHVFVDLTSQSYRTTKLPILCSWIWNQIFFWCRFKKKVQESLKILSVLHCGGFCSLLDQNKYWGKKFSSIYTIIHLVSLPC